MKNRFPSCFKSYDEYKEFLNFHHHIISAELVDTLTIHTIFDDGKETIYHILDSSYEHLPESIAVEYEPLRNDPELLSRMSICEAAVQWTDKIGLDSEVLYHLGKEIKPPIKRG